MLPDDPSPRLYVDRTTDQNRGDRVRADCVVIELRSKYVSPDLTVVLLRKLDDLLQESRLKFERNWPPSPVFDPKTDQTELLLAKAARLNNE